MWFIRKIWKQCHHLENTNFDLKYLIKSNYKSTLELDDQLCHSHTKFDRVFAQENHTTHKRNHGFLMLKKNIGILLFESKLTEERE